MEWESTATHERILQDAGPWTWYLPEAWRQASGPELHMSPGRRPTNLRSHADVMEAHADWIAYWTPLLHLTSFGLGWRRPELGLWRWSHMGGPTEHPVLATIAARYGPGDIALMTAWLVTSGAQLVRSSVFGQDPAGQLPIPEDLSRQVEATSRQEDYGFLFGGGSDNLHLSSHLEYLGGGQVPQARQLDLELAGEQVDYLLVGEQYRSLFAALHSGGSPSSTAGRSTRIAVLCPSIGWLGNYRRSRETGLWFRGQHRWHQLGN